MKILLLLVLLSFAPAAAVAADSNSGNSGQGSNQGQGNSQNNGGGQGNGQGEGRGQGEGGQRSQDGGNSQAGGNGSTDALVAVPDEQTVLRKAVKEKRALPFEAITARVSEVSRGRILDVELVSFNGILLYDVTIIESDGLVHRLYYNARSGSRVEPK